MTLAIAKQKTITALSDQYGSIEARSITRILFEDHPTLSDNSFWEHPLLNLEQQEDLERITTKLLKGKPVQYLVGKANFYGLFFKVDPMVLIPRAETEELVHLILETIPTKKLQIGLDIGTGSGCIPITLKHKRPDWELHAADVSEFALDVAQANSLGNRAPVDFYCFDILEEASWPDFELFDFIVSNPPYIPPSEKALMPDSVLAHEPVLALFAPEDDPLIFYRTIMEFSLKYLKKGGYLFFEANEFNANKVVEMMKRKGFVKVLLKKDMQGKDRMVVGQVL